MKIRLCDPVTTSLITTDNSSDSYLSVVVWYYTVGSVSAVPCTPFCSKLQPEQRSFHQNWYYYFFFDRVKTQLCDPVTTSLITTDNSSVSYLSVVVGYYTVRPVSALPWTPFRPQPAPGSTQKYYFFW